ncbi:MAG: TonB family protein [Bacteroidia bacterium]
MRKLCFCLFGLLLVSQCAVAQVDTSTLDMSDGFIDIPKSNINESEKPFDTTGEYPSIDEFVFASKEPEPLNMPEVRTLIGYPQEAIDAGSEGQVVARILVNKEGGYVNHRFVKADSKVLSDAVSKHLNALKFSPALINEKAVHYWVNIPFAFKLLGPEEQAKKLVNEEIERLTAAIDADKKNYQDYTNRALQYVSLAEYDKATADFDKSISMNPGKNKKKKNLDYPYLYYAYLGKGKMLLGQEKWSDAQAALDKAIGIAEDAKSEDSTFRATFSTAYAERGSAFAQQELYEAARRDYDKALMGSDSANTCTILSMKYDLCLKSEDYQCVVSCIDGMLTCDIQNQRTALLYNRGYYRMKYKDYDKAVEDFKEMLESVDDIYLQIAALDQMAMAEFGRGNTDKALELIAEAKNINVLAPQPYFFKAKIMNSQGKKDEACELIDKALNFGLFGDDLKEAEKMKLTLCNE